MYNHLKVPESWNSYFSKYPQGLTIMEALLDWVGQVDSMIDHINTTDEHIKHLEQNLEEFYLRFDSKLTEQIQNTLQSWIEDGTLEQVISQLIENRMTYQNIQALQQAPNVFKLGTVVELLGYHHAGDGSGHKRIISETDDGSGVAVGNKFANLTNKEGVLISHFGVLGDGTDETILIQKAVNYAERLCVFDKNCTFSTISSVKSNFTLDFTGTIQNGCVFIGEASGDLATTNNIKVINFNCDKKPSVATPLLQIKATNFVVENPILSGGGNGALDVAVGSKTGVINNPVIKNAHDSGTRRAIWLCGVGSDFSQGIFVDNATLQRNQVAIPKYCIENITINNPIVEEYNGYGIYLVNTRNTVINNAIVKIKEGVGFRNIAINNYNDNTQIRGGCLTSGNASNTGILCTQYSQNSVIDGVKFVGNFGGNRAVYCQYLSDTLITNCDFTEATGTQQIQIDTNAKCKITNSKFKPTVRALYCTNITQADLSQGKSCTVFNSPIIENNIFDLSSQGTNSPLEFNILTNDSGVKAGAFKNIRVLNNVLLDAKTAKQFTTVVSSDSESVIEYENFTNQRNAKAHNDVGVSGNVRKITVVKQALFSLKTDDLTVKHMNGEDYRLTASRSGNNIILSARTNSEGGSGSNIPIIKATSSEGIVFKIEKSGSNHLLSSTEVSFTGTYNFEIELIW